MARPKTKEIITIRLSIKIKDELQEIAPNEDKFLSELGREIIDLGLQEKRKKKVTETQWRSRRTIYEQAKKGTEPEKYPQTRMFQCAFCKVHKNFHKKRTFVHIGEGIYKCATCGYKGVPLPESDRLYFIGK
ncbi:MAG: hypothetical protein HWN66_17280 [Candidatus Helarchaeota archaeon]|nr:hypothetical protein [Candidatus Helarchaeota archaeon]